MKLEKYVNKRKKRRKVLLISMGVIVLVSISFLLYKTFARYSEEVSFPMMNGKVDYYGNSDVYFAFYKGDEMLDTIPEKDNSEGLVYIDGKCDNGASIEWDSEEWAPLVKNLSKSKTKCSLYFDKRKPTVVEYITELAKTDKTNLIADDTSEANIRYVGEAPNNYIDIGDGSLWRIIGVMNKIINLDDGGRQESLVKIIRATSIGDYSWDSSASTINNGFGVNEWSEADLMKLLNPHTVYSGTPAIGGSLYWNRGNGNCYMNSNEGNIPCDFTSSGISEEAKKKIAKIRWNTGTVADSSFDNKMPTKYMYEAERSSHNGKEQCASAVGKCTDIVLRTTTWDGFIGLMYPSDYGYAVGESSRKTCLETSLDNWTNESCKDNDWLNPSIGYSWTITPRPYYNFGCLVFHVRSEGIVGSNGGSHTKLGVVPVGYLKSSIKITGGTGDIGSPFTVSLN